MSTPSQNPDHPASELLTRTGEVGMVPLDLGVRTKLSIMMFLQYFTWARSSSRWVRTWEVLVFRASASG